MGWMYDWIANLPPPVQAAIITASATLVGAFFGFWVIYFQLGKQGSNAIAQSKKNESLKLKVQIYENVATITAEAEDAVLELTTYLNQLRFEVGLSDLPKRIPKHRFPEYLRLNYQATTSIVGVMLLIERWHIIDPRLSIFRSAIAMGLYHHREVSTKMALFALSVEGHAMAAVR